MNRKIANRLKFVASKLEALSKPTRRTRKQARLLPPEVEKAFDLLEGKAVTEEVKKMIDDLYVKMTAQPKE